MDCVDIGAAASALWFVYLVGWLLPAAVPSEIWAGLWSATTWVLIMIILAQWKENQELRVYNKQDDQRETQDKAAHFGSARQKDA